MKTRLPILMRAVLPGFLMLVQILGFGTVAAYAHGDAALTITPDVAAPGQSITIAAEGVEAGEVFTLKLMGVNFDATLGEITVGDDEDFHEDFIVPADAPPGAYQIQAISEGGETLTVEFTVLEASSGSSVSETPDQQSADPIPLERNRSAGQWAALLAGILVSAVAGIALVRKKDHE